jgi:DNA repair exonuclease SbcCD ATPase subunit
MTSLTMTAYCEQCEAQRQTVDLQQITMRNGRPATRGTCPVCGSHLFKIGSLETILRLEAERRERRRSNSAAEDATPEFGPDGPAGTAAPVRQDGRWR